MIIFGKVTQKSAILQQKSKLSNRFKNHFADLFYFRNFAPMIKWLKRYISLPLLIVAGFVAYVLFFNENSVMRSMDYAAEIRSLEEKIAQCEDTLRHYEALNRRLDSDPQELERIVREHYHMQRPSEDVYICD